MTLCGYLCIHTSCQHVDSPRLHVKWKSISESSFWQQSRCLVERAKQEGEVDRLTVYLSQVEDTQMAGVYAGAGFSPSGSDGSVRKRPGEER